MKHFKTLSAFALLAITTIGQAQQWQWDQSYDGQRGSFVSVVQSCANPIPQPLLAADDFGFLDNFQINHIKWWGTVSDVAQLARAYNIRIFGNNMGQPNGNVLFQRCVVPTQTAFVGVDCEGNDVYAFYVQLANPIPSNAGHFWISIAESDAASVNVGQTDFQWSGRRPIRLSAAGQSNGGAWLSPLVDPCDQGNDDLAFCLG